MGAEWVILTVCTLQMGAFATTNRYKIGVCTLQMGAFATTNRYKIGLCTLQKGTFTNKEIGHHCR